MSKATIRTGIDTWADSANPSKNYGSGAWVRLTTGAKEGYLYLKSPVPLGATVLTATLYLYGSGSGGTSRTLSVQRLATSWKETGLNWSNKPAGTGGTATCTKSQSADPTEYTFDVTAQIAAIAAGATGHYGWKITSNSASELCIYSLNAPDNRPYLYVEWSDAPSAPSELIPSGNGAVSVAKPTLLFNFFDVSGSQRMQACQVKINATNTWVDEDTGFSSASFDSGTVSTAEPQLDLNATAYAGISIGASAWWCVRVQDGAGLWSKWSVAAQFQRISKSTVQLNSPTGGVCYDSTQTVLWTVTGTQIAWRLMVALDSNPVDYLHDTGRKSGTTNSYTIPSGVLTKEGATYRLTLRVWDNLARVGTPNDIVHIDTVTTFVLDQDAPTGGVTGVTVQQVASGQPAVWVDWYRTTAPDRFEVLRDDVCVGQALVPADCLVSGTHYHWKDRDANPTASHTWKVRAVVNNKRSPATSASLAFTVDTVWLVDKDTDRMVPILFEDEKQLSFSQQQNAAIYYPANGQVPVRLVQGPGALEGSISGVLCDYAGSSAATWVANLKWMREHPMQVYRLTVGGMNIPVQIGNVLIAPTTSGDPGTRPDDRAVSFDFWSQDPSVT